MASYIFEFVHGNRRVTMLKDDNGMYRIELARIDADGRFERVCLGILEDRRDAELIFNAKVQKITSEWVREDR